MKLSESIQRLKRKIVYYLSYIIMISSLLTHKNAFVFGAPFHSNLGDQAQTYCIQKWINLNYPKYKVRIYTTDMLTYNNFKTLKIIKMFIKKNDLLFLHSGYHTTDLYMLEEKMQRKVIILFKNRKIIAFPQTIYYTTEEEKAKAEEVYNSNNKYLLMCRDDKSYSIAKQSFYNAKLLLYPDIVTSLIGLNLTQRISRKGILLCLRNDKESILTEKNKQELVNELQEIDDVKITDTTRDIDISELQDNREKILLSVWNEFASYRVVVTDRYHGTIFSLIANTPVLVISSSDHKLKSGVNWFPKEFSEYVKYIEDNSQIFSYVKHVYETTYDYDLPDYFNKNYFSTLKKVIEEEYK